MDNAELIPPTPKSMSDWELEQALETAKSQADGMLAAMILLEQESQLRSEDDAMAQAWIAKMEASDSELAASALADFISANPRFAKDQPEQTPSAVETQPEPAQVFEPVETFSEPELEVEFGASQPEMPAEVVAVEAEDAPVVPVPIPAPVSYEASFDEMLAVGATEATDAITIPQEADFSVTGVLGQIVQQVNSEFSADEDATALEESEHAPVGAFGAAQPSELPEIEERKTSKAKKPADWASFWSQLNLVAIAVPAVAAIWAVSSGVSKITLLTGLGIGLLINLGLQALFRLVSNRGEKDPVVLSRASFGVYANVLPSVLMFAFRSVVLIVTAATSVLILVPLIAGAPEVNAQSPLGISWLGILSAVVLVAAMVLSSLPAAARVWVQAVSSTLDLIGVGLLASTQSVGSLGALDLAQVLLISVVTLIALAGLSGFERGAKASKQSTLSWLGIQLGSALVLPLAVAFGLSIAFESIPVGQLTFVTFANYFLALPLWAAQTVLVVAVLFVFVLASQLFKFAGRSLEGIFVARIRGQQSITFLVAAAISVLFGIFVTSFDFVAQLVLVLFVPVFAWLGIFLSEGLLRRLNFHDVSLQRGYAFYKRISIVALVGFSGSVALGLGLTSVDSIAWVGYLTKWFDGFLFFGNLSGAFWAFVAACVWSLITSIPKIHKQESEIAAIDERRSEIAGVELPQ